MKRENVYGLDIMTEKNVTKRIICFDLMQVRTWISRNKSNRIIVFKVSANPISVDAFILDIMSISFPLRLKYGIFPCYQYMWQNVSRETLEQLELDNLEE